MGKLSRYKDEICLIIGGVLVFFFLLIFVGFIALSSQDEMGLVMFSIFFMFLITGLPGIFLFRVGWKERKTQNKLEKIDRYLSRNRRVRIKKLAEAIEESELNTVSLLEEGMDKEIFNGSFQKEDGEQIFVYAVDDLDYDSSY